MKYSALFFAFLLSACDAFTISTAGRAGVARFARMDEVRGVFRRRRQAAKLLGWSFRFGRGCGYFGRLRLPSGLGLGMNTTTGYYLTHCFPRIFSIPQTAPAAPASSCSRSQDSSSQGPHRSAYRRREGRPARRRKVRKIVAYLVLGGSVRFLEDYC